MHNTKKIDSEILTRGCLFPRKLKFALNLSVAQKVRLEKLSSLSDRKQWENQAFILSQWELRYFIRNKYILPAKQRRTLSDVS